MNVIFCPDQKYFVIPVLLMHNHYQLKGESVIVLCSKQIAEIFDMYEFKHYKIRGSECFNYQLNTNFVFFQHNTTGSIDFFRRFVSEISSVLDSFRLSFMPDGLGNAMFGDGYLDYAKSNSSCSIELQDVFSFGFVHSTVLARYDKEKIICLTFESLTSYFSNVMKFCNTELLAKSIKDLKDLVFITYRPWCTPDFHGGLYNFGTPEKLGLIYNNLLSDLYTVFDSKLSPQDSAVLFRGDSRFKSYSDDTFKFIYGDNKILLDDIIPDGLTLEPVIDYLINYLKRNVYFVTLDSTTFQSVPFILRNSEVAVVGSIGCFEDDINNLSQGDSLFFNKVTGKIRDFSFRYNEISKFKANLVVTKTDKGHFYVSL